MIASRRRTDLEPTGTTESVQLEITVAEAKSSISRSINLPSPPVTSDSGDTLDPLERHNSTHGSIRDSEQADPGNVDANRTAPREFGALSLSMSPGGVDLESFYQDTLMMELDWLFGDSTGQGITPFNSSSLQWNSSQVPALNSQPPTVEHQATEPIRIEKPSPMASHVSNTPSWPTDYLSNVDESDHNQLVAAASPQDQAQHDEHEETLARSTKSRYSYLPQDLERIAIEGRMDELPKYLDDDSRKVISVAFWAKWVSK